jgi:hypothetical protein
MIFDNPRIEVFAFDVANIRNKGLPSKKIFNRRLLTVDG